MAGGVGSRFWPASRENHPKQFLDILGIGKSLIRLTFERFLKIVPPERILVITNNKYKTLVSEHIPEIPEQNIIGEPSRNNTGPSIAYAAFRLNSINPNSCFVVAPSDHVILKEDEFIERIQKALDYAAENPVILTLGIKPTRPDTGYGYIQSSGVKIIEGIEKVQRFQEKPDKETATAYLEAGSYYWNAGIFVWSTKTILGSYKQYADGIYSHLSTGEGVYNSESEEEFIQINYPKTESISVDYAILEKADNVYVLPVDIGWSDLGTWNALHAFAEKDNEGTVVIGDNTKMINSKNCIVKTDAEKLVIIKDLEGYIVIDEKDVLLVYPKEKEQEIKALTNQLLGSNFK